MLIQISIQNYIFIENANLDFFNGLNIMTGETGSGKSIFLGALNITLGSKVSTEMIKPGNDILRVISTFDITKNDEVLSILDLMGIEPVDNLISLRREITSDGKSRCYINDRITNVSNLKKLGTYLVDIHSQRENQIIYQSSKHQVLYDSFLKLDSDNSIYKQAYANFLRSYNELVELNKKEKRLREEKDYLEFTIKELKGNLLSERDYDKFKLNLKQISNSEKIDKTLSKAHLVLSEKVYKGINEALDHLKNAASFEDRFNNIFRRVDTLSNELDDISVQIKSSISSQAVDPAFIDELNGRLQKTESLRKKYGLSFDDLYVKLTDAESKLKSLDTITYEKRKVENAYEEAGEQAYNLAVQLNEKRKNGIKLFEKSIQKELNYLNMQGARLSVNLENVSENSGVFVPTKKSNLNESGLSQAVFIFSPAPESDFKSLKDIASGGEASRIMLALKKVLLDGLAHQTLVLDEIDSGIGGKTALNVGNKIKEIAGTRQLFVITHLPQIAKHGDRHFKVVKSEKKNTTNTKITMLSEEDKIQEISRMIAGNEKNQKDLNFAKDFLTR